MTGRIKLAFRLVRDSDGYPPADREYLWAEPLNNDRYRIDNIPFFVKGISAGDVVHGRQESDGLMFDGLIVSGGHSTIRVVFFDDARKGVVRANLQQLGCESEVSHLSNLIAVDVPPAAKYRGVIEYLQAQSSAGILDYEEASIRHSDSW